MVLSDEWKSSASASITRSFMGLAGGRLCSTMSFGRRSERTWRRSGMLGVGIVLTSDRLHTEGESCGCALDSSSRRFVGSFADVVR